MILNGLTVKILAADLEVVGWSLSDPMFLPLVILHVLPQWGRDLSLSPLAWKYMFQEHVNSSWTISIYQH